MNVFINLLDFSSKPIYLDSNKVSIQDLRQKIFNDDKVDCYFTKDGQYLLKDDLLHHNDIITPTLRLRGGKGGFGSMLRAMGSQIEKTTNREACRDLSGRRMRDVNNEKKMGEWIKKKQEQEEEREKNRIAKLERQLERPKHFFNDPSYEKSLETTSENVDDALKSGLIAHKRSQSGVRGDPLAKKSKIGWLGEEDSSDSDDDDAILLSSNEPTTSQSSSNKAMTSQSSSNEPLTSQSNCNEPMTSQSNCNEPMTSQSNCNEPMTSQSNCNEPMTLQSNSNEPMTSQSNSNEPMTSQSNSNKPMTSQSSFNKPMTSQ